ncbi:MAG: hypothetical protein KF693_06130 [Nitrospira sp.]|nr:hypothetical protein [Nitrospira sp.]
MEVALSFRTEPGRNRALGLAVWDPPVVQDRVDREAEWDPVEAEAEWDHPVEAGAVWDPVERAELGVVDGRSLIM